MKTLYVLQGVPGSGKSTVARAMAHGLTNCVICSTDDFFYQDGEYRFDPARLAENHAKNLSRAVSCMQNGFTVILDNTNIKRWHVQPYVEAARENGYSVVYIRVNGQFANIHGVPDHTVCRMRDEMEDLS